MVFGAVDRCHPRSLDNTGAQPFARSTSDRGNITTSGPVLIGATSAISIELAILTLLLGLTSID